MATIKKTSTAQNTTRQRNTLYGFSIKNCHSWSGLEGIFTECDLLFDGTTVGHCVLDGDGGADHYDFPTAALNHAIAAQATGFPEYARDEAYSEPFALSYLVAVLADMQASGKRGVKIGRLIDCREALNAISKYRKKIDELVAQH